MINLPTFDDVVAASEHIKGHAHETPVMTSRTVDEEFGAKVFFKCENLQRMGAFKFRGGFNSLSKLGPEQRKAGVVAFSSGNHAQAVALSATLLGIPATILMPDDAPTAKMAATKGYGGNVVTYDRYTEDREQICRELAERRGLTLIPPYDHPDVLSGQGGRPPRNCSSRQALWMPSSCRWAAAGCCPAVPWLHGRCRRTAGCTGRSLKRVMTASVRSARAALSI